MKIKYIISMVMFLVSVSLLIGTVSAATESDSWNLDENTNYTDTYDKSITSDETDNFKYYAILKYKGKADTNKPYTGYFLAKSKDNKIKIKSVTLQLYDGNTGKIFTKTFKGNDKNQILIKLGVNRTVNVIQNGPGNDPLVAQIAFQRSTDNSKNNETSNNSTVKAVMKETGIPINLILLVLLSVLGVLIGKKH